MDQVLNAVTINGVTYYANKPQEGAESFDGMEYKIIRTYSAGVFAGYVESRDGKECVMRKVRRIWYWDGAASLSQLAVDGTKSPTTCKFPCEVDKIELTEVVEVLTCTKKAQDSIKAVPIWEK